MPPPFVAPRFTGHRFEQHTLPVSVAAAEFSAYADLLIDVAKSLYLNEHPGRQRIPKGFSKIRLDIVSIEPGSATVTLALVSTLSTGPVQLPLIDDLCSKNVYYARARDIIAECIAAPEGKLPSEFPPRLLVHFNKFGRSLGEGETLQLDRADRNEKAELTSEKRKRLVLAANSQYEREFTFVGSIGEADWNKSTFHLLLDEGKAFAPTLPMTEEIVALARQHGGKKRDYLFLKGTGLYDASDRLRKVISIVSCDMIKNYKLALGFEQLARLQDGWYEGGGRAPDKACLQEVSELLLDVYPETLPFPLIVPTQEGNILLEWQTCEGWPSLDIDLQTKRASFHAFDEHDHDIEEDFLCTDVGIETLLNFLTQHLQERQA